MFQPLPPLHTRCTCQHPSCFLHSASLLMRPACALRNPSSLLIHLAYL